MGFVTQPQRRAEPTPLAPAGVVPYLGRASPRTTARNLGRGCWVRLPVDHAPRGGYEPCPFGWGARTCDLRGSSVAGGRLSSLSFCLTLGEGSPCHNSFLSLGGRIGLRCWRSACSGPSPHGVRSSRPELWTVEDLVLAESSAGWKLSPDGSVAVWVKRSVEKVGDEEKEVSRLWLSRLDERFPGSADPGSGESLEPGVLT